MRRFVLLTAVLALLAPATAEAAKPARSWAHAEIKLVVSRGLMAESVAAFKPNAPLTQTALSDLVAGLTEDEAEPRAQQSAAQVTIAQLDARLVRALGLGDAASSFNRAAATARTRPPARFGTEVVARLLGLRKNHEAPNDALERLPSDPATRAEAAYSAAQILRFSGWELREVEESAAAFELPDLTSWQRRILSTAFGRIGFPYVWGGESDTRVSPFGVQTSGGFDCSGFAWRVFKHQTGPGGAQLARMLGGRTAAAMAGEAGPNRRIRFANLAPADLVFFADGGPRAKPAAVDHMGINIGNGWMIHSSRQGVALARLDGWYARRLAWGRRPILEAGLS